MGEEEGRGSGRKREHMKGENRQPTQHKKMRCEGEEAAMKTEREEQEQCEPAAGAFEKNFGL
jgi:hypothetical protein